MYVQRNTQARSRNHCCSGKAMIILLEPEFYIYILAHPVGKMRIIQKRNKVAL